jgi:hypothetical protein
MQIVPPAILRGSYFGDGVILFLLRLRMLTEINADQASGTSSSSMGGGGVTSGNFISIKRPSATSVNT